MTTIRVAKRRRFAQIDRRTVNDRRLSFRARGVLLWLLDKPDGWQADPEVIANDGTEGRDAIRSALRELEEFGYLVRNKQRGPAGNWISEHLVFEHPDDADHGGISALVEPDPQGGKPALVSRRGSPALVSRPIEKRAFDTENESSSPPANDGPVPDDPAEEERIRIEALRDLDRERIRARTGQRAPIIDEQAWLAEDMRRIRDRQAKLAAPIDPPGARIRPQDLGCEQCGPHHNPGWLPILEGPDAGRYDRCPTCNPKTKRKAS